MARLFPGFWQRFESDPEKIYTIIGNYAESSMIAHAGLPKNALDDSQSALEGLARWILDRPKSPREPANVYIKDALSKAKISSSLNDYPYILKLWRDKYKTSQDENDGPTFITRLRNKATHAEFTQMDSADYRIAWNLSQRYVELLLLRQFGYTEDYYDRVKRKNLRVLPIM